MGLDALARRVDLRCAVRLLPQRTRAILHVASCTLTIVSVLIAAAKAAAQERLPMGPLSSQMVPAMQSLAVPPGKYLPELEANPLDLEASSDDEAEEEDEDQDDEEDEDEDDDDGNQITPIIEELFLGSIVYPQEQDEVQLTFGYFEGIETFGSTQLVFEIEYGITDRLQIGLEVPIESMEDEESPFDGMRELGLELYYNFYSDRHRGKAYGVGIEFGLPVDAAEGESRAYVYEPFAIAYQEFRYVAVNLSSALEIEDPIAADESTETVGQVAVGLIAKTEQIVPILELQVEIAADETPILLAPGLYLGPLIKPLDVAISVPIGLNDDAPDVALFFMAVIEFEASALRPRSGR